MPIQYACDVVVVCCGERTCSWLSDALGGANILSSDFPNVRYTLQNIKHNNRKSTNTHPTTLTPSIIMAFGGVALKSVSLFFRLIEFGCAAVIIGIFSYYLATLTDHSLPISVHIKAVEGISGAAVLYTIAGFLLVCCLGGIAFFSMLGMLLDFAFTGAFAYIAWVNRHATDGSCSGFVRTAYGNGYTNLNNNVVGGDGGVTILPRLSTACRLQKAAFAVAIIGW